MDHVLYLRSLHETEAQRPGLLERFTGRFYTHPTIGRHLIRVAWRYLRRTLGQSSVSFIDPFAGDGRLAIWLIELAAKRQLRPAWRVVLWDLHSEPLSKARRQLKALAGQYRLSLDVETKACDAFRVAPGYTGAFDLVATNPPWETLKPDRRELARLSDEHQAEYVQHLRNYEQFLKVKYPLSRPHRKFAGWGTHLARVGVEAALSLCKPGGLIGLVAPSSLLADQASIALRKHFMRSYTLEDVAFFPAEARLFGGADVGSASLFLRAAPNSRDTLLIWRYDKSLSHIAHRHVNRNQQVLGADDFRLPVSFGHPSASDALLSRKLRTFGELEGSHSGDLWAGRELDETRLATKLSAVGVCPFLKGRMVSRFQIVEQPTQYVLPQTILPSSAQFERIAWRDVSRPNQKRRMIATIIPKGWITGNSLGVTHFRNGDGLLLRALLGIMNSFPFEYQLRSILSTGHVSLTGLRKVRVPALVHSPELRRLAGTVDRALEGDPQAYPQVEAAAAYLYRLSVDELRDIISCFPKVDRHEASAIVEAYVSLISQEPLHTLLDSFAHPIDDELILEMN